MASPACATPEAAATEQEGLETGLQNPAEIGETKPDSLDIHYEDSAEYLDKYNKYIALYSRRLKAKYFSKKAFYGGDIFDHEDTVENVIFKSSRWPCTRSFADPICHFEDQNKLPSLAAETSPSPDKKYHSRKNC